ncbi:MAG TPA: hypothetical protein VKA30_06860 [Actinomycetota bacterium]|nr:hypothetical protein [Actinomycetota bacterium]
MKAAPVLAAGHGWALAAFPLVAALIAALFGVRLAARFAARRRPFEGAWAVALLMYSAASAAMFAGVLAGWNPATFRIYYLLGAVLNVPYLFLGELYLLSRRRWVAHLVAGLLLVGTAFASWEIGTATLHERFLSGALPLGREVFGSGSVPHRLAQYYSFPAYFLLLGGLVWSAAQMRGRPELRHRVAGTMWIAVGATIVAIGSGIGAGFHVVPLFSVSLAVGIAAMYWGFLEAGRPARAGGVSTAGPR